MKSLSIKEKIATVLTEKLLRDLREMPSFGKGVVNHTRSAITRLFTELSVERQAMLMYLLRQTASRDNARPSLDLETLTQDGPLTIKNIDTKRLEKMRREVQYVHGVVASTVLVAYGGLGEHKVAVEG